MDLLVSSTDEACSTAAAAATATGARGVRTVSFVVTVHISMICLASFGTEDLPNLIAIEARAPAAGRLGTVALAVALLTTSVAGSTATTAKVEVIGGRAEVVVSGEAGSSVEAAGITTPSTGISGGAPASVLRAIAVSAVGDVVKRDSKRSSVLRLALLLLKLAMLL